MLPPRLLTPSVYMCARCRAACGIMLPVLLPVWQALHQPTMGILDTRPSSPSHSLMRSVRYSSVAK